MLVEKPDSMKKLMGGNSTNALVVARRTALKPRKLVKPEIQCHFRAARGLPTDVANRPIPV
jgi:hypothetical protein